MIPERFDITPWNIDPALRYATVIDGLRDIWRDDITIAEIGSGAAGITEFLDHPVTGERVDVESPLPPALARVVGGRAT